VLYTTVSSISAVNVIYSSVVINAAVVQLHADMCSITNRSTTYCSCQSKYHQNEQSTASLSASASASSSSSSQSQPTVVLLTSSDIHNLLSIIFTTAPAAQLQSLAAIIIHQQYSQFPPHHPSSSSSHSPCFPVLLSGTSIHSFRCTIIIIVVVVVIIIRII